MSQNNPKQEPVLSCINCGYTHKCSDTNSLKKSNSSKQEKELEARHIDTRLSTLRKELDGEQSNIKESE